MNQIVKQSLKWIVPILLIVFVSCNKNSKYVAKEIKNRISQGDKDVYFGSDTARVTIFMYASYQCKYCRLFFKRTLPELKDAYLDKGTVKLVVKWVPFGENMDVMYSMQAASCIFKFGNYDKFHELLVANPTVVYQDEFRRMVEEIMAQNMNIAECILSDTNFENLKANVIEFRENDLSGTPTIVIENKAYSGYMSFETLNKILKEEYGL